MSNKIEINYMDYIKETLNAMTHGGVLLVSVDGRGKPNAMTIGWGTIGVVWAKPIFVALVRPSRYTYGLLHETGDFTVNVAPKELAEVVSFCGSVSGRDHDKFSERGLIAVPGKTVKAPIIDQCVIHYECRIVNKNDVLPDLLAPNIRTSSYARGDFHRMFYGEILSAYADSDAKERLSGQENW